MKNAPHRVSVVIPTYQRRDCVERVLGHLGRQTLPSTTYEVIVVIDGSDDGTRELVAGMTTPYRLRSIWQPNRGRAAACNTGIRAATGELIVLLDDDMAPTPDFMAAHVAAHAHSADLGVVGAAPIRLDGPTSPIQEYVGIKFNRHLTTLAEPGYTFKLRDFYSGNFSIRRQTLLAVGGFNEAFKVYGNEDLELSVRLRSWGVRLVYSPAAIAYQSYTKDFAGLARDHIAKGQTSVLLVRLHPETLPDLKLNTYDQGSHLWRFLRASLLTASRVWPSTPGYIIRGVQWLEQRRPPRLHLLYDRVLDYCYWLGVQTARGKQRPPNTPLSLAVVGVGKSEP